MIDEQVVQDIVKAIKDVQDIEAKIQQTIMDHFAGRETGFENAYLPLISCARTIGYMISYAPPEFRGYLCSALFNGIKSVDPELISSYLVSSYELASSAATGASDTKH